MNLVVYTIAFALAIELADDAFAVSLCKGAKTRPDLRRNLGMGAAFGAAHAIMPLLGWALGFSFAAAIQIIDHWLVFAVIRLPGLRTMRASLSEDEPECTPMSRWALLGAAVATS